MKFSIEQVVDKLPSSKLYKILASSHKWYHPIVVIDDENERECLSTIKDISTTDIRDDISTQ